LLEVASRSVPGSTHLYEDRILVDEKLGLFAVADGVTLSSRGSGAVAAELALSLLRENFSEDIEVAVSRVHEIAMRRRKEDGTIGETTLTAVAVREGSLRAGNVGDSPAYLVREGNMQSLIHKDRSPFGYITQVIGYPETVSVHSTRLQLEDRDVVIVASDGVEHVLRGPLIRQLVGRLEVNEMADAIIEQARAITSGYDDDKSVIVLRFLR
jgi:serine/threonine protein phosphatase PrpC